jgi:hypothetical protein
MNFEKLHFITPPDYVRPATGDPVRIADYVADVLCSATFSSQSLLMATESSCASDSGGDRGKYIKVGFIIWNSICY